MFVLFEGLDLSGKSTLCREMSKALGWPVRHNSLLAPDANPAYLLARQAHLDQRLGEHEIGGMFLRGLEYELDHSEDEAAPWIQDSTVILRSITYHTALGNRELAEAFAKLLPRHPKPALAYLCRPSVEVRLKRLEGRVSRGNDNPEDFVVRDQPAMFRQMEETILDLTVRHFPLRAIDTSHLEDLSARARLVAGLAAEIRELTPSPP